MNLFTSWKDKATQYVDVRLRLIKLGFIERTSTVLGHLMLGFILLSLSLAILVFLGVGLLEIFSSLLDSRIGGALLTMGVYVLMMVITYLIRKPIVRAIAGIFIRILTEGNDEHAEVEEED